MNLRSYCGPDREFQNWMEQINLYFLDTIGVGVFDLRDQLWRDQFDRGVDSMSAITNIYGGTDANTIIMAELS